VGRFDGGRPNAAGTNLKLGGMEIKRHLWAAARTATAAAAVSLACAGVWDTLRLARVEVPPAVSYVLAAVGALAACAGVLMRLFSRRPARARNLIELAVAGIALLAWWLRGDAGIPADPPLVAAELFAALVLAGSVWLGRGRPRPAIGGRRPPPPR